MDLEGSDCWIIKVLLYEYNSTYLRNVKIRLQDYILYHNPQGHNLNTAVKNSKQGSTPQSEGKGKCKAIPVTGHDGP
jgi:hypothetical protein